MSRSEAAKKGWETRRARAREAEKRFAVRSEAAKKGWETRRAKGIHRESKQDGGGYRGGGKLVGDRPTDSGRGMEGHGDIGGSASAKGDAVKQSASRDERPGEEWDYVDHDDYDSDYWVVEDPIFNTGKSKK